MTVRGKDVVKAYYGAVPDRAVLPGMLHRRTHGLMEVQRYPQDFDGVIAGAPVYTLQTQTSGSCARWLSRHPARSLTADHLTLINKAVLAACDAQDGAADGVVRDPRACNFDPAALALQGRTGPRELSCACAGFRPAESLCRRENRKGHRRSYPLDKGGETGWARFIPATGPAIRQQQRRHVRAARTAAG